MVCVCVLQPQPICPANLPPGQAFLCHTFAALLSCYQARAARVGLHVDLTVNSVEFIIIKSELVGWLWVFVWRLSVSTEPLLDVLGLRLVLGSIIDRIAQLLLRWSQRYVQSRRGPLSQHISQHSTSRFTAFKAGPALRLAWGCFGNCDEAHTGSQVAWCGTVGSTEWYDMLLGLVL